MTFRERRRYVRWLRRHGFAYPIRTMRAVRKTGIHPAVAAVLLLKESNGGRNIFGCDQGSILCHERVTRARVQRLLRHVRAGGISNGVGPTQLTWRGYIEMAEQAGGAHRPQVNMETGFRIFVGLLNEERSLWEAARRYNGGAEYADDFMDRLSGVRKSLKGAGVE